MFKHESTGLIYSNRLDAIIVMGTSRYKKALKNREFIFNYELQEGEQPIEIHK